MSRCCIPPPRACVPPSWSRLPFLFEHVILDSNQTYVWIYMSCLTTLLYPSYFLHCACLCLIYTCMQISKKNSYVLCAVKKNHAPKKNWILCTWHGFWVEHNRHLQSRNMKLLVQTVNLVIGLLQQKFTLDTKFLKFSFKGQWPRGTSMLWWRNMKKKKVEHHIMILYHNKFYATMCHACQ